jgi:hypothetical protein
VSVIRGSTVFIIGNEVTGGLKLTTHLKLVLRVRIDGVRSPFLTISRHAQRKHNAVKCNSLRNFGFELKSAKDA